MKCLSNIQGRAVSIHLKLEHLFEHGVKGQIWGKRKHSSMTLCSCPPVEGDSNAGRHRNPESSRPLNNTVVECPLRRVMYSHTDQQEPCTVALREGSSSGSDTSMITFTLNIQSAVASLEEGQNPQRWGKQNEIVKYLRERHKELRRWGRLLIYGKTTKCLGCL